MTKTAHAYPRGQYPSRVLSRITSKSLIDHSVGYVTVHLFVAAAWRAMVAEIKAETGKVIYASGPAGGYRSLALELWMHTNYRSLWPKLAPVGQSNHNEADCIDRYSWEGLSPSYVNAKLKKFGFRRDPALNEEWHLQHNRADTWYVPKVGVDDTRKVYLIPGTTQVVNGKKVKVANRYYLAGSFKGASYLNNTTVKILAAVWIARWGRGTPYKTGLLTIHAKAGRA